jgi:hypothetical protein
MNDIFNPYSKFMIVYIDVIFKINNQTFQQLTKVSQYHQTK